MAQHGTKSWKFGDVTVTRVVEIVWDLPTPAVFPTGSNEVVRSHAEWLNPQFTDEEGNVRISVHSFVVQSRDKTILVDTCVGCHVPAAWEAQAAPDDRFLKDLTASGFPADSINVVVNTHLHIDHVGWNIREVDGVLVPTFPNARYLISKPALDAWRQQDPSETFSHGVQEAVQVVVDAGLVDEVPMDHRVTDEVRFVSTPGHARGHISLLIESQGAKALITGDLSHHPVQWAEIDWYQSSDSDPHAAAQTRRDIVEEYADTDAVLIGTHYNDPTAGRLVRTESGLRFVGID